MYFCIVSQKIQVYNPAEQASQCNLCTGKLMPISVYRNLASYVARLLYKNGLVSFCICVMIFQPSQTITSHPNRSFKVTNSTSWLLVFLPKVSLLQTVRWYSPSIQIDLLKKTLSQSRQTNQTPRQSRYYRKIPYTSGFLTTLRIISTTVRKVQMYCTFTQYSQCEDEVWGSIEEYDK